MGGVPHGVREGDVPQAGVVVRRRALTEQDLEDLVARPDFWLWVARHAAATADQIPLREQARGVLRHLVVAALGVGRELSRYPTRTS